MEGVDRAAHAAQRTWPTSLTEIASFLPKAQSAAQLVALERERPRAGEFEPLPEQLHEDLRAALLRRGISSLYSHQAAAVRAANEGRDVVVTTPTASGKTLCFNVPVIDSILNDPLAAALYLYPTKALANDQLAGIRELLGPDTRSVSAAVFTGDTPREERSLVIGNPPNILIANPDILHFQQLADHMSWERWWRRLRWVVIDEAHIYRGVFGAHIADVLRRVLRVAAHYEAAPQFIAASATIANPVELVSTLTGRTPVLIANDGAPRPGRDIALWRPKVRQMTAAGPIFESVEATTADLVVASLLAGKSCIAFARSRRTVERIRRDVDRQLETRSPNLVGVVRSYRAGYDATLRREIERGLRSGGIRAVVATMALELGIDIGSLDVAILSGYPGSGMSFWQQAGRAGRRERRALVVLVVSQNPLDVYVAEHPDRLIRGAMEDAIVDPSNDEVASRQLTCAARELTLRPAESTSYGSSVMARIASAEAAGWVVRVRRGWVAAPGHGRPDSVSLRGITDTRYVLAMGDQLLGEIESRYVPREAHEGAIYLHDGDPYRVASVDDDQRLIHVRVSDDGVLTDPIGERLIIERGQLAQRSVGPIEVALLEVTIVDRVTGYQEIDQVTMRQRGSPFDLPRPRDMRLETIAVRIKHAAAYGSHLHALEHTIRALGSLVVVCDPADLQGHTELEGMPKAYIYDRTAGGVGLARRLFERLPEVLAAARDRIASCACDSGCPACIQSGSCPRRNEALDKAGALSLVTGVV